MDLNPLATCFCTLGCRLNQLETEEIAAAFRDEGFAVLPFQPELANAKSGKMAASPFLCVINTCAVTAKAEQKARRIIRLALKNSRFAAVIVTGCYAQTDAEKIAYIREENFQKDESLDRLVILPGRQKDRLKRLPSLLRLFIEEHGGSPLTLLKEINGAVRSFCAKESEAAPAPRMRKIETKAFKHSNAAFFSFHSRGLVKIQDGCSRLCTFCKTRLARGPAVSAPSAEIIERVRQIEQSGIAEVVLTGVNLSEYRDPLTGARLAGLLQMLLDATSRIFIRLSSLYPENVTAEFADVAAHERICPFFHLSIQSGSEKILRAMGRGYTAQDVMEGVKLLQAAKKNPFISCDIITGFPGETDEDFMRTEELCEAIGFAHIHVFPFSPREGTAAASMKGRVTERVSRERAARLEVLSLQGGMRYRSLWRGKTLRGVFEYSKESGKFRVFTVNALSLPLDCETFLRAGGMENPAKEAEALQNEPERLRGAPILVKVAERGDHYLFAELEGFLFKR